MESSRRALAFGSVKTRFKAFWSMFCFEQMHAALDSQVPFSFGPLPPTGRLNYEAYNVDTKS